LKAGAMFKAIMQNYFSCDGRGVVLGQSYSHSLNNPKSALFPLISALCRGENV